jgi:archaellum component FlaC
VGALILKGVLNQMPQYFLLVIAVTLGWYVIKKLEETIHQLEKKIERLEEKIEAISTDFITKEQHYRDVSGWRGEIQRLEDRVERNMERLLEKIIEITKIVGGK